MISRWLVGWSSRTDLCCGGGYPPQLDVELLSVVCLLEAALTERPPQMSRELPAVLQALMPLLHSPLAAPRIQRVFLHAGHCLMPKHLQHLGRRLLLLAPGQQVMRIPPPASLFVSPILATLVGHVTLRLLKPECDLDQAWEQEELQTAAQRTVLLLHGHTVPQREAKSTGESPDSLHQSQTA